MHSHTCMIQDPSNCDSIFAYKLLGTGPLPASSVTCPPASVWFVSLNQIIFGEVCFDTTCNITDCFQDCRVTPKITMNLFNMFCPHPHAFRETSHKVIHLKIAKSSTLNCGVLMVWARDGSRHLILVWQNIQSNYIY